MYFGVKHVYRDEASDRGDEGAGAGDEVELDAAAEAEAAEKAAADAEALKAEKDEGKFVPKGRFDKALEIERNKTAAAEAAAKELQAKLRTQDDVDQAAETERKIGTLEDALDQAIADGDADKKKALRAEIRELTQGLAEARAGKQAAYATALAVEKVQYGVAVSALEAQFPHMNPDHESYDAETVGELIELKEAYEAKGMGSTDAIKKAAKYVFKTAPAEVKKEAVKDDKGDAAAKQVAADAAAKQKEDAIKRGLEAKAKQPPSGVTGKASDKAGTGAVAEVGRMSDADFGKLSEEEISRMRGDSL